MYRLGVGAILLNKEGKVFVGQRSDQSSEAWQLPQGGIEEGEDYTIALMRELAEEIGTDKVEIIYESKDWYQYEVPLEIAGKLWNNRYIGQKQKWFLLKFVGEDKDINIQTSQPEFHSWRWADLEELPELIVYFKRKLYQDLIEEFLPIIKAYKIL